MKKCEGNGLDMLKTLPVRFAVFLLLLAFLCLPAQAEETRMDGFYELKPLVSEREGETAVLLMERSYYSGDMIFKGHTSLPLNGACALHCGAVLISNLHGETVTGQQVAKANNRDIRNEARWTPYVSWGKVASAFGIGVHTSDLAQYGNSLKNHGVKTGDRRVRKMEHIVEIYRNSVEAGGMMIHFNSSGRLNGSGIHRHAVVLVGYIERDGRIADLLVNDSSVPAPEGVCIRMSESSLPVSIIGQKKLDKALDGGEDIAMLLMDYAVSCRWADIE